MSGTLKGCPNIKVFPFLRFNLMISASTKMPYQEFREISDVREKSGKMKVEKVATLTGNGDLTHREFTFSSGLRM